MSNFGFFRPMEEDWRWTWHRLSKSFRGAFHLGSGSNVLLPFPETCAELSRSIIEGNLRWCCCWLRQLCQRQAKKQIRPTTKNMLAKAVKTLVEYWRDRHEQSIR